MDDNSRFASYTGTTRDSRVRASPGRRSLLIAMVGLGGIVVSLLVFWMLRSSETRVAEARFEMDAQQRVEAIQNYVRGRLRVVSVLQAFFAASKEVERHEFHTFAASQLEGSAAIRLLAWAPQVKQPQRSLREKEAREDGLVNYRITEQVGPGRFVASPIRDRYYPLYFIEPSRGNEAWLGLDLGSRAVDCLPLKEFFDTGGSVVGRLTPVFSRDDRPVFLLVAPVYRKETLASDDASAEESIVGVVAGVFDIQSMLEAALKYFDSSSCRLYLFDDSTDGGRQALFTNSRQNTPAPSPSLQELRTKAPNGATYESTFIVANRQWTLFCEPGSHSLADWRSWTPIGWFVTGLLLTSLLVVHLAATQKRTARVEQLAADRTAEFFAISESVLDAVVIMNAAGRIMHWNPAAERTFGYRREDILGRGVHETLVPARYRESATKGLQRFAAGGRGAVVGNVLELDALRSDGSEFPIEISVSPILVNGQQWAIAIVRDITARKRAEEAILAEQRLLKELLNLQERERKLTAYEIHDGLAQLLAGAMLQFQCLERFLIQIPSDVRSIFEKAMSLLSECLVETRRLIGGLRPPILDESGVLSAVEYLVCENQQRGGPEIQFFHHVQFHRLAPPLESAIFRVVQESLTNAARHSQSNKVRVELAQHDNWLRVEIVDSGIGFDTSAVDRSRFGLRGIRERARLLGGVATIESAPGKGTRVIVELPLLETVCGTEPFPLT